MQKVKYRRHAVACMVVLAGIQLWICACGAGFQNGSFPGLINAQAASVTVTEGLAAPGATETLPEPDVEQLLDESEPSDEELDQMVDQYLEMMGNGDAMVGDVKSETIVDPRLKIDPASWGKVRYTLPNKSSFTTTAPNGMITTEDVSFEFSGNVMAVVHKDDEASKLVDEPQFTEPGSYHLRLLFYQTAVQESTDFNVYEVNYYFTIIGKSDGTLGVITAPKDFRISEAKKDGVPLPIIGSESVFLEEDGIYEIWYQDLQTGTVHVSTRFERDTTAPFLTFSKELTGEALVGPVEYYPSERGATVTLTYNGNRGPAVTNELTSGGLYQLEVTDQVGNTRYYQVNIRQTFDLIDARLIILALILLGAMGLRLLFLRRDMRVI